MSLLVLFLLIKKGEKTMSKLNFKRFANNVRTKASDHLPDILLAAGIASGVTATVLAVKATPKALELIEEKKVEEGKDELTTMEVVKTCWKPYIPAATSTIFGVGCIMGSRSVNTRRSAALATAYKLSETALAEYKEKVIETIGEEKEKKVKEKVKQVQLEKDPVSKKEVIITGRDNQLFYDYLSGRYFYSSVETIQKAQNKIKEQMLKSFDGYTSLNQFYEEIGLPAIGLGYELGWSISTGTIEIECGDAMVTDDNRACIVIDYRIAPRRDFDKIR